MAGSIATLKAMLTLDTSKFNAGFASAAKQVQGFASGLASKAIGAFGGMGSAAIGAGVAMATAGISFSGLFESLGHAGSLVSFSKKLGITVEETQRLAFAASKAGIDMETLANGLLLMGKNIGSGGKGLDKRFLDVADAFTKISDAGERAKFAREVFGRGGFEFINLLAKGSAGIRSSADAIDRFGIGISSIEAKNAKEALLTLKELKEVIGGLKDKVIVELGPSLKDAFTGFLNDIERVQKILATLKSTLDSFRASAGTSFAGKVLGQIGEDIGNMSSLNPAKFMLAPLGAMLRAGFGKDRIAAAAGGADEVKGTSLSEALTGGKSRFASGAAQKGTVAAAEAIISAQEDPTAEKLDKLLLVMQEVARNTRRQLGGNGGMALASL